MKEKLILLLFGTTVGLAGAFLVYSVLMPNREGVEFNNVDEFRAALKDPRANGKYRRPDGSLPFVAVIEPHPSEDIIYTLRPGLHDNFTGVTVTTNSQGMRSPERPIVKPEGTYRIALMGDSFAFGWGVDQDKSFAQVLEDTLNERFKGSPKVEVLNFGIPGYSSFQEVALFTERGLQFKPDAVLFFFVDNDFEFPFFIRDSSKPLGLVQSFSLGSWEKSKNPVVLAQRQAMIGRDPVSSFKKLDAVAKQEAIPAFIAVNPGRQPRGVMKRLSPLKRETEIRFVPLTKPFDTIVRERGYTPPELTLPNDPHPSVLCHRIYGTLLADGLEPTIEESSGGGRGRPT